MGPVRPGWKKISGNVKADAAPYPSRESTPTSASDSKRTTRSASPEPTPPKVIGAPTLSATKVLGAAPPQKFRADSPREKTPADDGKQGRDEDKKLTVKREGGGKQWEDTSLLEWDPSHFRLFVGNLSQEVTDEMLKAPFERYKSLSKVRVVKDHRTDKCKGFGFVAFVDPEDYFKAFKEVNGKYVGNHPIQLKRATTEIKPSAAKTHNRSNKSRHRR